MLSVETKSKKFWLTALGVGVTTGLAYYTWKNYQNKTPATQEIAEKHNFGSGMNQTIAQKRRKLVQGEVTYDLYLIFSHHKKKFTGSTKLSFGYKKDNFKNSELYIDFAGKITA